MDWGLLFRSIYALAVIGLLLFGLWWTVRNLGRGRLIASADRRLVSVIESAQLAQNTTLHVVKVADRYYLLGGGQGNVSLIDELPPEHVGDWIAQQQRRLDEQTERLRSFARRVHLGGRP